MESFVSLAQYGSTGVAIVLIIVGAWLIKAFIDHSKQCRDDVTGVIRDHTETSMKHTAAIENLSRVIETKL